MSQGRESHAEETALELLAALVDAGIDFVVIGGVAVAFHAFVRATKDADIVPAPDPGNLDRLWNDQDLIDVAALRQIASDAD